VYHHRHENEWALQEFVIPYFEAVAAWYERLAVGVTGGELYDAVHDRLDGTAVGVALNPGHYINVEEWMDTPVYENSAERIVSGAPLQMDVIPTNERTHWVSNVEDGVVLADETLRERFADASPDVWERTAGSPLRRSEELEQVVALGVVEVAADGLVQGFDRAPLCADRGDGLGPLLPRRVHSQPLTERVEAVVAVVDLVDLVDGHDRRDVEIVEQVEELHVVGDVAALGVAVDDVDGALAVDDEDADEDVLGVLLEVAHHVGLDRLAALVGDAAHEAEAGEVGEYEVLGRPVVVIGLAGHARLPAGLEAVARQLAHQSRLPDVRPADEHHLRVAVGPGVEHATDRRQADITPAAIPSLFASDRRFNPVRLVQVVVPAGKRQTVLDSLDEEDVDYAVTDETSSQEYAAVVSFPLPAAAVEEVLSSLREAGIDDDAFTVVTAAETVVSEHFEDLQARYAEDEGGEYRIAREELQSRARDLVRSTRTYAVLTVVSGIIATAGLLLNSPATVVGSMVIAPLIGPAMSAAVGSVVDDEELFARGVRLQVLGMTLAVASAAAFAFAVRYLNLIPPTLDPAEIGQVRERIAPNFLSLAVALGAGTAGAISLFSGVPTALVGVMIAVALVPPAATVGVGIAYGLPTLALSSGVLALVNGLSINLAALLVLSWAGYRPQRWFREDNARSATLTRVGVLLAAIAVLSVFLGGITYDSYTNALDEQTIQETTEEVVTEAGHTLIDTRVETETHGLLFRRPSTVVVTVGIETDRPPDLAQHLDDRLDAELGVDAAVEVQYVQIDRAETDGKRQTAV